MRDHYTEIATNKCQNGSCCQRPTEQADKLALNLGYTVEEL